MAHNQPIRIFIVDDHQIMIDGINALLQLDAGLLVVGQTTDPTSVMEALQKTDVQVLIADVHMPLLNGIDLTRQVKSQYPDVNVLALTMFNDRETIAQMLEAGVAGYVLKNTGKDELIEAVRTVAAGRMFFTDEVTQTILSSIARPQNQEAKEPVVSLTAREIEIVKLIGDEKSNAEIGEQLFISERTVETHRKNIFRKTNTKSVAGLIRYALSVGIIA